ncbi:MAG TPA: serine/threonine-protein kinase [Gemmataceae bacterium]
MTRLADRRDTPSVPGYELTHSLGGGPLSRVFAARCRRTDAACAVKLLRDEMADDATAVKLLRREARAGLLVRHPHLVRVLGARLTRPPYFLVMEMLPGEPLRQRLRREYALDVASAVWAARQTAEALAALHRAGFVHADVKPENVRLVNDGRAVLIDLGFAHRPGENRPFFEKGFILGTANYLAPELCRRDATDAPANDLFSLGVMLFEMLTGELPYPAGSVREVMRAHETAEPADLRDYPGAWPPRLAGLVRRLLARRPGQRPTAAEAVRELIALEIAALRRRGA